MENVSLLTCNARIPCATAHRSQQPYQNTFDHNILSKSRYTAFIFLTSNGQQPLRCKATELFHSVSRAGEVSVSVVHAAMSAHFLPCIRPHAAGTWLLPGLLPRGAPPTRPWECADRLHHTIMARHVTNLAQRGAAPPPRPPGSSRASNSIARLNLTGNDTGGGQL